MHLNFVHKGLFKEVSDLRVDEEFCPVTNKKICGWPCRQHPSGYLQCCLSVLTATGGSCHSNCQNTEVVAGDLSIHILYHIFNIIFCSFGECVGTILVW